MAAAQLLRMARRRAGLSQRELARRSGVPQATISRIENAIVSPTVDTLEPLIRACGMELRIGDREGDGVDRSQLTERLRMSTAERADAAMSAAAAVRRWREAGRVRPAEAPT